MSMPEKADLPKLRQIIPLTPISTYRLIAKWLVDTLWLIRQLAIVEFVETDLSRSKSASAPVVGAAPNFRIGARRAQKRPPALVAVETWIQDTDR